MAPLSRALSIEGSPEKGSNDSLVYTGEVDGDWTMGAVPNGGYSLGLIISAVQKYQASSKSSHLDPIHVTAHYLHAAHVKKFQVRIRTLKAGKAFTNILADFIQDGQPKIMTHMIFGTLAATPKPGAPDLTIIPPSPYARRHPLYTPPSSVTPTPVGRPWNFKDRIKIANDPVILSKNKVDSPARTNSETIGEGGVEWGAWVEFTDEDEQVTTPSLALLVDVFPNFASLLPKSERRGLGASWFPTMVLSIEFKCPIPSPSSPNHSSRTVGLYSTSKFSNGPEGRHDAYVEVWTSPGDIGGLNEQDGWRDNQICLAIATQMALTVPLAVNLSRAKLGSSKL